MTSKIIKMLNRFMDNELIQIKPSKNSLDSDDWKWLMPVVEKIESIYDEHHGYFAVYIGGNSCTIQGTKLKLDKITRPPVYFNDVVLSTKIKSTYQAIVTFIEWYDKNLKK